MSRICPLTGKKPMYGNNRSHSLRATRRRWNVNLQKTTLVIDGKKTTLRLSTAALRTLRKNKKAVSPAPVKPVAAPVEAAPVAKEAVQPEVKPVEAAPKAEEVKAEVKPVEEKKEAVKKAPAKKKAAPKKAE
jgi:large subunit ribosomal protein L28